MQLQTSPNSCDVTERHVFFNSTQVYRNFFFKMSTSRWGLTNAYVLYLALISKTSGLK